MVVMTTAVKRVAFGVLLAVLGAYAVTHLRGPNGLAALNEKRNQIKKLEAEKRELEEAIRIQDQTNKDLTTNIDLLKLKIKEKRGKLEHGEQEFREPRKEDSQPQ